jgi:ATP-dependent helicase/nuclease subunit A
MISGVASSKADDGIAADSWYQRLSTVQAVEVPENAAEILQQVQEEFELAVFDPPCLAPAQPRAAEQASPEQLEGTALHALMERLTHPAAAWPIQVPAAAAVAEWLRCGAEIAASVRSQAQAILGQGSLERYFNPAYFRHARNEMDILFEEQVLRLDRIVVFEDEVWILDYKRQLLDMEMTPYRQQLDLYACAIREQFAGKTIRKALILSDGALVDMS